MFLQKISKKGEGRNEIAESSIASAQKIIVEHSRWKEKAKKLAENPKECIRLLSMFREFLGQRSGFATV